MFRGPLLLAVLAGALLIPANGATAASAPLVEATWVTDVTATSANLRNEINPGGASTTYRFDYIALDAYEANVEAGKEPFAGAAKAPSSGAAFAGAGTIAAEHVQHLQNLTPSTVYRFRVVATSPAGTTVGPERSLGTEAATNAFHLLDGRGWEMVSPVDKNGGSIQGTETIFGGGAFQAAGNGESLAYSSLDSFGAGAQGAPGGSQYVATRATSGWQTQNITTPLLAGSYGESPDGVPYQLFSPDLGRGLLSNGQRCRTEPGECPVANPPLPGSGAVAGYRDYYLREPNGGFESLLDEADLLHTSLGPKQFEVTLAGASEDLSHVVLSSCAALSMNATEVAAPGGCAGQNLYEWSAAGLSLLNVLPGDPTSTPGAALAASSGAISDNGSRVYFVEQEDGGIYLGEGSSAKLLPETIGGGAVFQTASNDGRFAFFTSGAHLYRYDATSEAATDLTPAGGVQGVLGASSDGSHVYYLTGAGLFLWDAGATTEVAAGAMVSDYPPALGTARVSADGSHLLFLSAQELTDYDNDGQTEVYLYGPLEEGAAAKLSCISCNPTGERPQGSAAIPGAIANGSLATAFRAYKPRVLSANGLRVFFESADDMVIQDTNNALDVYEWEAPGVGDCAQQAGCVGLVSSGRSPEASRLLDASSDGSDVFFVTEASLAAGDPGSYDVYDAREGGGFPVPPNAISCDGDACQALPAAPEDPTPGTLVPNGGNPAPRFTTLKGTHRGGKPGKKHHGPKKNHHRKRGGKR